MSIRPFVYSISLLAVMLLVVAGCAGQPATGDAAGGATTETVVLADLPRNQAGYVDLSVDQLQAALQDKDFTMVNVHIPYEGELPQTDLFIPFDEIDDHLAELPAKDEPIVLYCRSGSMSTTAAEVLADLGYTQVYELDGGFRAWQSAGHELLNNP